MGVGEAISTEQRAGPGALAVALSMATMCLVWGSTWLVIKGGLRDLPPFLSAGLRFGLAAAVMAALAHVLVDGSAQRPPWRLRLAVGLGQFGGSYAIVYWSETVLPSGLVSLLWAVFPLLMGLCGHALIPGERLAGRQWWGLVLAFGGVALLFATDVRAVGPAAVPAGLVLLCSPLITALSTVTIKREGRDVSSILLNRDGMVVGSLFLLAAALVFERGSDPRWTPAALGSIAYLALFGTVLTFGLYYWLMRWVPVYRLSMVAYVTPLLAITLGALVGGEPVGPSTFLGAACILGGVAAVLVRGRARRAS